MNTSISMDNNFTYKFLTDDKNPKGIIHISHGKGEHMRRYSWLINKLNRDGYHVISQDHRGHGMWVNNGYKKGKFAESDGWEIITNDLVNLIKETNKKYPLLKQYLFAHSMGSWVGLSAIMKGLPIRGLVLSGSTKQPNFLRFIIYLVVKISTLINGKDAFNPIMDFISNNSFNKNFKPKRTKDDWISSDPDNVIDYFEDDLCGFEVTNSLWSDFLIVGSRKISNIDNYSGVDRTLPVILISGSKDPFSSSGKGIRDLNKMLSRIFDNVENIVFENDRHEVFSGLQKDKAYEKLLDFFENIK